MDEEGGIRPEGRPEPPPEILKVARERGAINAGPAPRTVELLEHVGAVPPDLQEAMARRAKDAGGAPADPSQRGDEGKGAHQT